MGGWVINIEELCFLENTFDKTPGEGRVSFNADLLHYSL